MQKLSITILFFAIIIFLQAMPVNAISKLHVDGRYLKDEFGNVVVLKGVFKHGFEDFPGGFWKSETGTTTNFNEVVVRRNFRVMKSWGANEVRLIERVRYWKENTTDANGMPHRDIIKRVIEMANEEGLYINFALFSMDSGSGYHSYPWNTTQIPTRADFVNLWVDIATELGGYPNVMFELWNEVADGEPRKNAWFDGVNETIKAIRNVADNIIIVQWSWDVWYREGEYAGVLTLDWVNDPRIQGTNILYSTHCYRDCRGFYRYENDTEEFFYKYEDIKRAFVAEKVQTCVETWNKPLYIGEYGPTGTGSESYFPNELDSVKNALNILDEWGISYDLQRWWIGNDTARFGFFKDTNNRIYYDSPSNITAWGNIVKTHLMQVGVNLTYPVNITGTVTDSDTGLSIQGATVTCNAYSDTTNSTGGYFIMMTSTGSCNLTASKSGYVTNTTSISFPNNRTYTVNFTLEPIVIIINIADKLRDINNTPVKANITLYQSGTNIINATNQTDVSEEYSFSILPSVYDILYNITNFYIQNYWLKLNSVNISSNTYNKLTHVTGYPLQNKTSLIFNITGNQAILSYSIDKPRRVLKNNTALTEYPFLENITSNQGWYYNSTKKITYVNFNENV